MIQLMYKVDADQQDQEIKWLHDQYIFPSSEVYFDWQENKLMARFGMIVSKETATAIKLRHQIVFQQNYKK